MPVDCDPRLEIPLANWEPRPACPAYGGRTLPAHSARLAPDALAAILPLADRLVLVTGYRSPRASADSWREDQARPAGRRRGVARPGFSPHGVGLAVDLDVERTLARLLAGSGGGRATKRTLDDAMLVHGFRCWRSDGRIGKEQHHFTFSATAGGARAMDAAILARWPDLATPDARRAQRILLLAGFYWDGIDGDWGPRSRAAMKAWHKQILGLDVDGRLDRYSWRALLVGTARIEAV